MDRKRNTTRLINQSHLYWSVSFIFLLSIFTLIFSSTITTCLESIKCFMFVKTNVDFQELEEKIGQGMVYEGKTEIQMDWPRRLLLDGGPGSFPPRCTSKCGKCTPCKPGMPVMMEYYPQAWRCKCGNKYYMP
ncbi:hypothetical protein Lalb_Chr04g0251801 [Lupinus albus]|uniref:Epidermal patterning factor-like protein n=1 Tax=Lupinus albus TaxID=3870 RepID=A0A6A4QPE9_LUPAL|nr:hypothetical protein Lalb_Chr04g0251801 [Lupinus albus]